MLYHTHNSPHGVGPTHEPGTPGCFCFKAVPATLPCPQLLELTVHLPTGCSFCCVLSSPPLHPLFNARSLFLRPGPPE